MRAGAATRGLAFALAAALAVACAHRKGAAEAGEALAAAETEARAGRHTQAMAHYHWSLAADPSSLGAHRGYLESAQKAGKLWEVRGEYTVQTQREPRDPIGHYGLGLALYLSGETERAIAELRRAVELAPREPEYQHRLGVALLAANQPVEAKTALEAALALEPRMSRTHIALARARQRAGDRTGALAALGRIAELEPTPREVAQGRELLREMNDPMQGLPEQVRKDLEVAVQWLERDDNPQTAWQVLEPMLKAHPDAGAVHALAGLAWLRVGDGARAFEAFTRATELSPGDPLPHLYLAELYAGRGRRDRARAELAEALARDPLSGPALRRDAQLASEMRDRPAALGRLQRLVVLEPEDAPARLDLARLLMEGNDGGAEAHLLRLVDREPRHAEALLRLGMLSAQKRAGASTDKDKKKHTEKARSYLVKVLEIQPDNAAARQGLKELE
jgi:tetratricopeptide (TPR) repeat protein